MLEQWPEKLLIIFKNEISPKVVFANNQSLGHSFFTLKADASLNHDLSTFTLLSTGMALILFIR